MTMVGIRELKAHLSRFLRRVQKGESLVITDRGHSIATLTPSLKSPLKAKLWDLAQEGKLSWSGGRPIGLKSLVPSRGKPPSESIREERGERLG